MICQACGAKGVRTVYERCAECVGLKFRQGEAARFYAVVFGVGFWLSLVLNIYLVAKAGS